MRAHLLLKDPRSAASAAGQQLEHHPESRRLKLLRLEALCLQGNELEALQAWKSLSPSEQMTAEARQPLETLAWGTLRKASASAQLAIRMHALTACASTADVRAIPLVLDELRSSVAPLRALAVRAGVQLRDEPIRRELLRMMDEERVWYVRLELLRAVGRLQMRDQLPRLQEIISSPRTSAEEKYTAMIAYAEMVEELPEEELLKMLCHPRAGLRELACQLISYLELTQYVEQVGILLEDPSPDVRASAVWVLSQLPQEQVEPFLPCLRQHLSDHAAEVAMLSARALCLIDREDRGVHLASWLEAPLASHRRFAAAALASCGPRAVELMEEQAFASDDPFVRLHLALGLIGQRKQVAHASQMLFHDFFMTEQGLLMWDPAVPFFRTLAPSEVRHVQQVAQYPILIDQHVRLELLGLLALCGHEGALSSVRQLLHEDLLGISSKAASLLLQEGEEGAIATLEELLTDSHPSIRLQAALMLAFSGSAEKGTEVLCREYPQANREIKMELLKALGEIGEQQAIPFLLQVLEEPFQAPRVMAACALIRCLYH